MQHVYKTSPTGESLFYVWFSAMHTRVDIAFCGKHEEGVLLSATGEIQQTIHRLEAIGNFYDPNSELAAVNRMAALHPVPLSEELYRMLEKCLSYHPTTLGCFDISVHSENYTAHTIQSILLSPADHTIFFQRPGIRLNLSGFLKGYALDIIRPILERYGIRHALVNLGNSSILAIGNHPAGNGWKLSEDITLYNQCLTTSGNDTEARSHIVSPFSGETIKGKRQIKVITQTGAVGEIFSTALFAASEEQREELLQSLHPELIRFIESPYK